VPVAEYIGEGFILKEVEQMSRDEFNAPGGSGEGGLG